MGSPGRGPRSGKKVARKHRLKGSAPRARIRKSFGAVRAPLVEETELEVPKLTRDPQIRFPMQGSRAWQQFSSESPRSTSGGHPKELTHTWFPIEPPCAGQKTNESLCRGAAMCRASCVREAAKGLRPSDPDVRGGRGTQWRETRLGVRKECQGEARGIRLRSDECRRRLAPTSHDCVSLPPEGRKSGRAVFRTTSGSMDI